MPDQDCIQESNVESRFQEVDRHMCEPQQRTDVARQFDEFFRALWEATRSKKPGEERELFRQIAQEMYGRGRNSKEKRHNQHSGTLGCFIRSRLPPALLLGACPNLVESSTFRFLLLYYGSVTDCNGCKSARIANKSKPGQDNRRSNGVTVALNSNPSMNTIGSN